MGLCVLPLVGVDLLQLLLAAVAAGVHGLGLGLLDQARVQRSFNNHVKCHTQKDVSIIRSFHVEKFDFG